ncbi:MAG TPA: hypothetical protein PK771_02515 [Spirochaetota bacterium]|nr:hypothetical protein [Spirochaetota bacterium]
MKSQYNISFFRNPRYFVFIVTSIFVFCVNLFLFYLFNNLLFLIISVLAIFVVSYFIIVLNSKLNHIVFLDEDRISFQKTKSQIEIFYFREIKLIGFYKKNLSNTKFEFGDGLYIYDEKKDNYILIGVGFKNYLELFEKIKLKSKEYNLKWIDIERKKDSALVEELQKLLN